MVLQLTKRAWSKLYQITRLTHKDTFIFSIASNPYDGLYYTIKPYQNENLGAINGDIKEYQKTTNNVTNIIIIHPFVRKLISKANIDYQKSNYRQNQYSSKFVYDVSYTSDNIYDATKKFISSRRNEKIYLSPDEEYPITLAKNLYQFPDRLQYIKDRTPADPQVSWHLM